MQRGVRKSITIPGSLASAVKQRCREFGYASFTPYAVELVCYDLRSDAKHAITLAQTIHKRRKTLWIGNSWRAIGPASSAKGYSSSSSSASVNYKMWRTAAGTMFRRLR